MAIWYGIYCEQDGWLYIIYAEIVKEILGRCKRSNTKARHEAPREGEHVEAGKYDLPSAQGAFIGVTSSTPQNYFG